MNIADKPRRGCRTLRLPISKSDWEHFSNDAVFARETLDQLYEQYPEIFPLEFKPAIPSMDLLPYQLN